MAAFRRSVNAGESLGSSGGCHLLYIIPPLPFSTYTGDINFCTVDFETVVHLRPFFQRLRSANLNPK